MNIDLDASGSYTFRCIGDPRSVTYSGQIKFTGSSLKFECDGYTNNINNDSGNAPEDVKQQNCTILGTTYQISYIESSSRKYKNFLQI